MLKGFLALLAALCLFGSLPAHAQPAPRPEPSEADGTSSIDTRIAIVKGALQLTPEQEKLWPPVEDAIRARAEMRQRRIASLRERMGGERDRDPIELLRARADVLAERAAVARKFVDAWEPLSKTLSPDQKQRLRLLARHVLPGLGGAIDFRRTGAADENYGRMGPYHRRSMGEYQGDPGRMGWHGDDSHRMGGYGDDQRRMGGYGDGSRGMGRYGDGSPRMGGYDDESRRMGRDHDDSRRMRPYYENNEDDGED